MRVVRGAARAGAGQGDVAVSGHAERSHVCPCCGCWNDQPSLCAECWANQRDGTPCAHGSRLAGGRRVSAFAVYAEGYPAPMFVGCEATVGPFFVLDLALPGSTRSWLVRPTDGVCEHCAEGERVSDVPSLSERIKGTVRRYHRVLNRLESHLGCVLCHGPLTDGVCRACDGTAP